LKTIKHTNNLIIGYNDKKPIVADLTYYEKDSPQPIVIFCHGYKGYKDWGAWHLVAESFAKAGIVFLKFNFSHNGGTFENPIDFPDLEAFGHDNFSLQLSDLDQVISFVKDGTNPLPNIDTKNISLIGHSRGGGLACIMASENNAVKKLITWAAVSDFKSRFPKDEKLEEWKEKGVYYVKNGRTKQDMPHFYQFYKDFIENEKRFNIKKSVNNLDIPYLIIHGENDETVSSDNAHQLKNSANHAHLKFIKNATHTFNTSQPWEKNGMSTELKQVTELSIDFVKES